jgi:glutathione S-transferase
MPAFTLYGSRGSTNTDRVRLTLAEGGFTDYELVLLNLQKGEQKVTNLFRSIVPLVSACVSNLYITPDVEP